MKQSEIDVAEELLKQSLLMLEGGDYHNAICLIDSYKKLAQASRIRTDGIAKTAVQRGKELGYPCATAWFDIIEEIEKENHGNRPEQNNDTGRV